MHTMKLICFTFITQIYNNNIIDITRLRVHILTCELQTWVIGLLYQTYTQNRKKSPSSPFNFMANWDMFYTDKYLLTSQNHLFVTCVKYCAMRWSVVIPSWCCSTPYYQTVSLKSPISRSQFWLIQPQWKLSFLTISRFLPHSIKIQGKKMYHTHFLCLIAIQRVISQLMSIN